MKEPRTATQKTGMTRRSLLKAAGIGAGAMALADALLFEPRAFRVEEIILPLTGVPAGAELRLVHLSDLHLPTFDGYYAKVARSANALAPDIILVTGDLVTAHPDIEGVREFLGRLKAPKGVFAIQGNWEHEVGLAGAGLRRQFARSGAILLIDQRHDLEWQGLPVSILGLDYPSSRNNLGVLKNRIDPGRINLLMSHVPAFKHDFLEGLAGLILCGHTHGGQVRLPLAPALFLPRHCGNFIAGLYRVGRRGAPLYVNRGIGTSVIPVRFFCPPEITLFRLIGA